MRLLKVCSASEKDWTIADPFKAQMRNMPPKQERSCCTTRRSCSPTVTNGSLSWLLRRGRMRRTDDVIAHSRGCCLCIQQSFRCTYCRVSKNLDWMVAFSESNDIPYATTPLYAVELKSLSIFTDNHITSQALIYTNFSVAMVRSWATQKVHRPPNSLNS